MKPKNLCLVATVMALSMVTGLLTSSGTAHAQLPTVPHYDCYNIDPVGPLPTLPTSLTLKTQFGTETVTIPLNEYTDLCLPALKKVGTNWEGDLNAPHVECLPIAGDAAHIRVKLVTQFGIQTRVGVLNPIEACMPAKKSLTGEPTPPIPTTPHYECYSIDGPSPPGLPSSVLVQDQFLPAPAGTTVLLGGPTRLCLPAQKWVADPAPGHWEGDLNAPHVECFAITSGPTVEKYVYLLTQFGPYQEVHVPPDHPRELCVPVLKTVIGGVGGEQDLPDVAGNADSGGSSLPYAIAGAAMGLVVLGAGGWYARRRWLS